MSTRNRQLAEDAKYLDDASYGEGCKASKKGQEIKRQYERMARALMRIRTAGWGSTDTRDWSDRALRRFTAKTKRANKKGNR